MPSKPTVAEILEAQRMLSGYFRPTPLVRAPGISQPGVDVFLKLETRLPTGSFKLRGALVALAHALRSRKVAEVTASSTGNHGAAVAWAAKTLAVPATIFFRFTGFGFFGRKMVAGTPSVLAAQATAAP